MNHTLTFIMPSVIPSRVQYQYVSVNPQGVLNCTAVVLDMLYWTLNTCFTLEECLYVNTQILTFMPGHTTYLKSLYSAEKFT